MDQKTVFISYRRAISKFLARSIYQDLKVNGWDVFLDVNTIDSGDFDRIILNQIGARAHFILLISPRSLERCVNADDWVLREIEEAIRLERNIVPIIEEGADFIHEISYLPVDLRAIVSKKNALPLPNFFFDAAVEMLRNRFLKIPEYIATTAPSPAERAEVQKRMATVDAQSVVLVHSSSIDILPAPFAWIDIPSKGYSIAKYPITNIQFGKFVEDGGYEQKKWWTDIGWTIIKEKQLTQPRFWKDTKLNGTEQPVVGVSWYESVAFCLWLGDAIGEKLMLPTEEQWQYASQGDDGRIYPWGNEWDSSRCNNNVDRKGIGKTSTVRHYESKGDSPFGAVDMAGNIWEWCLTDLENKTNDVNTVANNRVLRGGSWFDVNTGDFRCDDRGWGHPDIRFNNWGFRISRS